MTNHIADKVIVITGAGSGFGKLVAEMTAAAGAKVVGADINEEGLKATADGIRDTGQYAEYLVTDVTDKEQMDRLAQHAIDKFGAIDVLVNNAGIMPLAYFADHNAAWRGWSKAIDINIKGVVNGISAVYDQMIEQGRGHQSLGLTAHRGQGQDQGHDREADGRSRHQLGQRRRQRGCDTRTGGQPPGALLGQRPEIRDR